MNRSDIDQIRRFNRLVTLRTGALNGSYLGRGRPLGQARLLFEIGPHGEDLRRLRERLGLDSGYMSRLLKSLSAQGMITVEDDPGDKRRRRVGLTARGKAEHAAYDALSDGFARSVLAPLSTAQQARLVAAMAEVETLMTAAAVTIAIEPGDSDDARLCVEAYYRELDSRFEQGFDPGSGGYAGAAATHEGRFMIARLDGRPVGCGALRALDGDTGEIKRMWIAPEVRGLGLSRRLLDRLEAHARSMGMARVRLDTNRTLTEARALYLRSGYCEIERYNDNSYADFFFEKDLRDTAPSLAELP